MYVNYYFKYAASNKNNGMNDNDFVMFLCKLAYYFGIRNIIIYTEYSACGILKKKDEIIMDRGGNYCIDVYKYLKFSEKRFQNDKVTIDSTELKPKFSYYELDRLRKIDPIEKNIIRNIDRDEIYQIYTKTYQIYVDKNKHNLADFYIWLLENHCVNLATIVSKMDRVYNTNNPFINDYYVLDAMSYLYNKSLIYEYPELRQSHKGKSQENISEQLPKNEYRLQYYTRLAKND
jgi:hypothetical protein